jgi:glyoxylase-like metal-dependent hydrolase (beta-lactamase superfamily II)
MKLHLLDLGRLDYDEGFPLAGAGASMASDSNPPSPRRTVAIIGALIEHPKAGPILFDTGAPANYPELWPPVIQELFHITSHEPEHQLEAAVQAAGYGLEDIRAIVLSHLHLDHAGGLESFRGSDVPVYVHADEL